MSEPADEPHATIGSAAGLVRLRRALRAVGPTLLWTAALVSALVAGRQSGLIEPAELLAYDLFVRARPAAAPEPAVAVVTIDDAAYSEWGWPVPDDRLAAIIAAAADAGASAVAVDFFRDVPVGAGHDALLAALSRPNVFGAMKFAEDDGAAVEPPAASAAAGRFGFVDLPVDDDGVIRRSLLYLDDGSTVFPSLALSATLHALAGLGVTPQADPEDVSTMRLGAAAIGRLPAHAGPYSDADNRGYQIMVDFRRPPGAVPVVDARALIADPLLGAALKDRIVFIGTASEQAKDLVVTPLRGDSVSGLVNGVMVHAWVSDQLVREAEGVSRPLSLPPEWMETALIVAAAAVGLVAGLFVASPLAIAGAGMLLAVLWAGGGYVAFLGDLWVPVVPTLFAAGASLAIAVSGRAAGERRERQILMRLFAQQVSGEVADDLWRRRDELLEGGLPRPLRLDATILFLDLAGSTGIADRLTPEAYVDWVGRFLERMAETAIDHGGLVDKFTGDGLMIVFGAPVPRTDADAVAGDAAAAVATARAMADELDRFNVEEEAIGQPRARARIGIHSGPVLAGCVGATRRRQYTVMGAPVNAAARLESLKDGLSSPPEAGDCRILISEITARLIGASDDLVKAGSVVLRGFSEPIDVYRIDNPGSKIMLEDVR